MLWYSHLKIQELINWSSRRSMPRACMCSDAYFLVLGAYSTFLIRISLTAGPWGSSPCTFCNWWLMMLWSQADMLDYVLNVTLWKLDLRFEVLPVQMSLLLNIWKYHGGLYCVYPSYDETMHPLIVYIITILLGNQTKQSKHVSMFFKFNMSRQVWILSF